ncbi:MarR family transcriptional regulator [Bradyrhizobium sp. 182]|uniref:hypothetical protein n=1 Tax=Bradyrhizobium sp. 182 TaxID=2782651 RepID=UPI001FF72FD3|nr:hypothetical protein [Bradyrhizobium sp. 182]MCK1531163.1 MarR family transcriptional regulator [Bradyrhizobium sp. 182]
MPRWQHRLLLDLACNPNATVEEIATACGYKLSSCVAYLNAMSRAGLIDVAHNEDDCGRLPSTYRLTDEGEALFEEIVTADAALERLSRQRRRRQRQ